MVNSNLIYTTFGYDINWINIVVLLMDSLYEYSRPYTYDFLIMCDKDMHNHVVNRLQLTQLENGGGYTTELYPGLVILVHAVAVNSSKPEIASMNKLRVFDVAQINQYTNILFIDGDVLCTLNTNNVFSTTILPNILYAYAETRDNSQHNSRFFGFSNYSKLELAYFEQHKMYPFNCGMFLFKNTEEMKLDFMKILAMIDRHVGPYFYEQSFMNYYFNSKTNINYELFNRDKQFKYILFPENNVRYLDSIIHFCGAGDTTKYDRMKLYKSVHLPVSSFETRNQMLAFYTGLLDQPRMLEIGVFEGQFLHYLYSQCNPSSQIDAVDLFQGTTCSGDVDGNNVKYVNIEESYRYMQDKYKSDPRITLYASDSAKFLQSVPDNTYDVIYIDGDHSYEGVLRDITLALQKVKPNGYIMGNDYEMNMSKARTMYNFGVKRAVDEFCATYRQHIIAKAFDGCVSFCIQAHK